MQSNQQYPQQPQPQPQQQQFQQQQQFPPQQQQPILVYPQYGQPQVFSRPAPSSTSGFAARSAVILGSLQIVIGILCILFQAAAIGLESQVAVASSGIYCGILFIITGAFGVAAGKTKGQCLIVTFMVFCIISAAFTVAIFTTSSLGLGLDANQYPYHYYHDYDNLDDIIRPDEYDEYDGRKDYIDGWQGNVSNWMKPEPPRQVEPIRNWDSASSYNYEYNEHMRRGQLASNGILLILAMAELIIAICASALCCKALCCKGPGMQPQYAVPLVQYSSSTGQPQMMVMNMAPQQGMVYAAPQPMVMPMQGGTVVQMSSTTPRVMTTTTAPPSGNQGGSTPPPSYAPVDPSANVPYNAVAAGQLQAPPSEMKENKA